MRCTLGSISKKVHSWPLWRIGRQRAGSQADDADVLQTRVAVEDAEDIADWADRGVVGERFIKAFGILLPVHRVAMNQTVHLVEFGTR